MSASQRVLQAKQKIYQSDYTLNKSALQSYDVYGGIEQESEQSILRIGVNIPLNIYHDRKQERMLSKLKMQQVALDKEQLAMTIDSQKQMIKSALKELYQQYMSLKSLQKEQEELTLLLTKGYKIAKGSLFQLMTAKNKLIQTKKALLQTHKIINIQKITLRFLQGGYND